MNKYIAFIQLTFGYSTHAFGLEEWINPTFNLDNDSESYAKELMRDVFPGCQSVKIFDRDLNLHSIYDRCHI